MRNKNALNPYRIESGAYYNLRKILAPKWGDGAYYYSAHVARTGRNGKNIAVILYHEIDD